MVKIHYHIVFSRELGRMGPQNSIAKRRGRN